MNQKKTMSIIKEVFFELKKDKDTIEDFANITYDVGFMVALCVSINRIKVGSKIYDYFLKKW
tara:strand:+ start:100 stop:285 length:186 start_codon:yes stop_codon:yes gene_type:complete